MSNPKLTIAAMGDLHLDEEGKGTYVNIFREAAKEANVLILCGDLTNNGLPEEAVVLAAELSNCSIPILAIPGNHDYHSEKLGEVKKILQLAGVHFLDDHPFNFREVGFAGAKGFAGGFGQHTIGAFGEAIIKNFVFEAVNEALRLENQLRSLPNNSKVVVLHYAPITQTLQGEPLDLYPFLGCSRLEESIDLYNTDLVLHGHSHRGIIQGKTNKGTLVYNCATETIQKQTGKSYLTIRV